jgi:hypothetical protein
MSWVNELRDELDYFDENPEVDVDNAVALRDALEANLDFLPRTTARRAREAIETFDASEDIDVDATVEIASYLRRVLTEARFREAHRWR